MDNSKTAGRASLRPSTRRLIQLYSALLHNAHLKGFIDGEIYQGKAKFACVPGFNCYSCPGAVGACPLGSIQNALASTGHRAGWYVMGIILLFFVVSALNSFIPVYWIRFVLSGISIFSRFSNFTQGAFDFSALLYYLSVMVVFLLLTGRVYDRRRYR